MELLEPEPREKPRRRGPKPLGVRTQFAATLWLDAEILWRAGRVVWLVSEREIEIGAREIDATSRAIASLSRHEKAARRHHADFAAWRDLRLEQLAQAQALAAVRAPDLEALCSPSRRRNPAALARLAALLIVESSVAEPLPHSPSRALFEAWPHSQKALKSLRNDESQPLRARALAALVYGATTPLEALPGEPFLRRAARFGVRFGFPQAPQLVVSLLESGGRDSEIDARRIEESLLIHAPFGFDAAQLTTIHRAGRDAATVAFLAEAALQLPDPFSPLKFAPVAPKRFDLEAQRLVSARWNHFRAASLESLRAILTRLARNGHPDDLFLVSQLLEHLISSPLRALGPLKIEKNRKSRCHEADLNAWQQGAEKAVAATLEILQKVANSPDSSAVLALLIEALPQCGNYSLADDLSPAKWAAQWHDHVAARQQSVLHPLLRLAQKGGATLAREALRLGCWRELARERGLAPQFLPLALEIAAWAPASASNIFYHLQRWGRHWRDLPDAQAAFAPLLAALGDAPPDQRALWLDALLSEIEDCRRGVRVELPALVGFLPLMRRAFAQSVASLESGELSAEVAAAVAAGAVLSKSEPSNEENLPRWALVDTALQLLRSEPDDEAHVLARFEWLTGEMVRRWTAAPAEPSWSNLGDVVALCAQLAGDDEPKFAALMADNWRFAGYRNDFEWSDVKRGARLARRFPALQNAVRDNLSRAPACCFKMLEILGPLSRFESLITHLDAPPTEIAAPIAAEWRPILEIDANFETLATRFITAKQKLDESAAPPAGALKIAAWPQKFGKEINALRSRSELPPNLSTRLENLVARLEDEAALRAAMRQELHETLLGATREAELCAAERSVELCYRARLELLGAPKNAVLDANLLNAALFSTDIESNRKWLREIVRAHCENRVGWRLEIVGNARWLARMSERCLIQTEWLSESPREFSLGASRVELRLEACPLQILQMGNLFGTCLSRGGINAHSSVANAVELNKRVVFARDHRGRIVGRQLLAISSEVKLLGFHVYTSITETEAAALRAAFLKYAQDLATRCGVEMADQGEVERLFVADWYDDGTINWLDLQPVTAKKRSERLKPKGKVPLD